jgi:hypothetical protein
MHYTCEPSLPSTLTRLCAEGKTIVLKNCPLPPGPPLEWDESSIQNWFCHGPGASLQVHGKYLNLLIFPSLDGG